MNARRFPGVRCSTLKTVCSSLLCLMIMPGRICVAGIAIKEKLLDLSLDWVKQKPSRVDCSPFSTCRRFARRSGQCGGRSRAGRVAEVRMRLPAEALAVARVRQEPAEE